MDSRIQNFLRVFPLPRILKRLPQEAQREAGIELFLSVLFSTLPIWFGSLINAIDQVHKTPTTKDGFLITYWNEIVQTVSNGELFFFVTAALGPTLYIGLSSFGKKAKPYPWIRPQLIVVILVNLFATVLFFQSRAGGYANSSSLILTSFFLYLVALALLYPAMVYDHAMRPFDPASEQQRQDDDFTGGYTKHRGAP